MKNLSQLIQFSKGGGGGGAAPTVLSSPPPPTTQSVEVQMAQRDAAKQAAKKRGLTQTVLAGETGGFKAPGTVLAGTDPTKKTLLGGGA